MLEKLYINIINNICRSLNEISIWSSNKTWVLGGDILVGKHSSRMFLVGNHQAYMHLRTDCGPLLFTQMTSVWQLRASAQRSGDWLSHYMTLMSFIFSHSFVGLVAFGSLSCWKTLHDPSPVFCLSKGGSHSGFYSTRSCPLAPHCSEIVLHV